MNSLPDGAPQAGATNKTQAYPRYPKGRQESPVLQVGDELAR